LGLPWRVSASGLQHTVLLLLHPFGRTSHPTTPFVVQWVALAAGSCNCSVSFVRGTLCHRHRASLIYYSTIITSRQGQFMFTDASRRPAVMGVRI